MGGDGFIDSDGHVNIAKKRIEFQSHPRDIAAYELIQTTYGRHIHLTLKKMVIKLLDLIFYLVRNISLS